MNDGLYIPRCHSPGAASQLALPLVITTIIGFALPWAIRLSRIWVARPSMGHASSSPPAPCSRYITGYLPPSSYVGGVYIVMRRCVPRVGDEYHTRLTLPWGTLLTE